MRRRQDIWQSFLDFFGVYPFFLLKPHSLLIADEVARYPQTGPLMPAIYVFSLLNSDQGRDINQAMRLLFGTADMKRIEKRWRQTEQEILDAWLINKTTFSPSKASPNARDAARYVESTFDTALFAEQPDFVKQELGSGRLIKREPFPTLVTMLYSMYYRLYDPHWEARPAEVTDVQIAAATPHVDAFVSESFQIEIFRKARRRVPALESVELVRAKDLGRTA